MNSAKACFLAHTSYSQGQSCSCPAVHQLRSGVRVHQLSVTGSICERRGARLGAGPQPMHEGIGHSSLGGDSAALLSRLDRMQGAHVSCHLLQLLFQLMDRA